MELYTLVDRQKEKDEENTFSMNKSHKTLERQEITKGKTTLNKVVRENIFEHMSCKIRLKNEKEATR